MRQISGGKLLAQDEHRKNNEVNLPLLYFSLLKYQTYIYTEEFAHIHLVYFIWILFALAWYKDLLSKLASLYNI